MNKIKHAITLMVFVLIGTTAFAQPQPVCTAPQVVQEIVIDLAGQESVDLQGAPGNTVLTICNPQLANELLTNIVVENLNLTTVGFSWCSEATIDIAGGALIFNPHAGETAPGPAPSNLCTTPFNDPGTDLAALGILIPADANGCITVELFETFDDVAGATDGVWTSGVITLSGCGEPTPEVVEVAPIPTLGEWGLIALSILMVIFGVVYMRREQTKSNSSLA